MLNCVYSFSEHLIVRTLVMRLSVSCLEPFVSDPFETLLKGEEHFYCLL